MDYRKDFFYKVINERPYYGTNPVVLYNAAKNNKYMLQRFRCLHSLNAHTGCVNTISWNSAGRYILSGSDDLHLAITNAFSGEIKAKIRTGHITNIFSAKYLPNTGDTKVVSCSGDGVIIYTDLNRPETAHQNIFDCQEESVYDIVTVPNDPNTFLTCSHDHTVRWYDVRVKQSCQKHPMRIGRNRPKCTDDILIHCEYPVTAIAVNQLLPWQLAIGCSDSIIRIYDRRTLSTKSLGSSLTMAQQIEKKSIVAKFTYDGLKDSNRITSLAYSRNCQQILASYSNDNLYLFNLNEVRNTIYNGTDADVISEKPRRQHPPYKRFRLRGDWSDTGPSALTSEELRNMGNSSSSSSNLNNSSSSSNQSTSSGHSNTTATTTSSTSANSSSSSHRSSDRLRQLSTILSILFRNNTFPGSNESLNETNDDTNSSNATTNSNSSNNTSVQANNSGSSSSSSTTATNSTGNNQQTSTIRERTPGQDTSSSSNNNDNNSESNSSDNSLGFYIQIFDDDFDYPTYQVLSNDDDDANGSGGNQSRNQDDEVMMNDDYDDDDDDQEDDDFDSDTTSDSVFNHDSTNNLSINRQRSRSSSSNDSRQSQRRKTKHNRSNQQQQKQQRQQPKNNATIGDKQTRTTTPNTSTPENNNIKEKRLRTYKIKNFKKFAGHRNSRTVIKEATFWGDDYIISGSDCGHIFFWSIETGEVVMILEGDQHVVNCLQPHPTDPILASSGIDYDIKIWGPDAQDNQFDPEKAKKIMSRNKHLLEESRDTVTVPARFVLSLFSSMQRQSRGQFQRDNNNSGQQQNSSNSEQSTGGGGNDSGSGSVWGLDQDMDDSY